MSEYTKQEQEVDNYDDAETDISGGTYNEADYENNGAEDYAGATKYYYPKRYQKNSGGRGHGY